MTLDINTMAIIVGLVVNVIAIGSIVTRSNVRVENRITRLETSVAFILQMMKVNLASSQPAKDD